VANLKSEFGGDVAGKVASFETAAAIWHGQVGQAASGCDFLEYMSQGLTTALPMVTWLSQRP
jgi:hypothetical protein